MYVYFLALACTVATNACCGLSITRSGILAYRRMVQKKDLVKIFYIYICLCHVCPAHPCGNNPLRSVISYSEKTGRGLAEVLATFKGIDETLYEQLRNDYQQYRQCIGMVDTGYFKRSWEGELTASQLPQELAAYGLYRPTGISEEDILGNDETFTR